MAAAGTIRCICEADDRSVLDMPEKQHSHLPVCAIFLRVFGLIAVCCSVLLL